MTIEEMLEKKGIEDPCKNCGLGPTWAGCVKPKHSCADAIRYFEKKWDLTCKVLEKKLGGKNGKG